MHFSPCDLSQTITTPNFLQQYLVKFTSTNIVEKIRQNKKRKVLNTSMLSSEHHIPPRPIYINEHMYKKARDARREKKVEFTWVKNGEVYVRKTANSRPISIKKH